MKLKATSHITRLLFVALFLCVAPHRSVADQSKRDISRLSPSDQAKYRALQREEKRISREIDRREKSLDEELREMQEQADRTDRQKNER